MRCDRRVPGAGSAQGTYKSSMCIGSAVAIVMCDCVVVPRIPVVLCFFFLSALIVAHRYQLSMFSWDNREKSSIVPV